MKTLKLWLESLRLSMTISAAFLVHAGFVLAYQKTDWLIVLITFLIATATMLQNDYQDRFHDIKKGKDLAYKYPTIFKMILSLLWVLVLLISARIFLYSRYQGGLLFLMIAIGMFYSLSKSILRLPTFLVAITSALPAFFALKLGDTSSYSCIFLALAVFLIIFGREIIKDVEDRYIDKDYKKTFLTTSRLQPREAQRGSTMHMSLGLVLSLFIWPAAMSFPIIIYALGFSICSVACIIFYISNAYVLGKQILDVGILAIILAISIIPLFS